ncbi:WSCD family member CG9164-like [Liolophura sinensis]|uniref:WSCD family member CG9164-like n=1 Tax=Liolophura sinensis TaxID=3198878 RepID=UPI003158D117
MRCSPVEVKLSPNPLPLTALVSFPGSGNTWVRHIVQQATGIGTGSVYCDKFLRDHGFPFECIKNGSVVLIKTHEEKISEPNLRFSRIVLLLRNPFDAIRAEFNRRFSKENHTGFASETSVKKDWPRVSREMITTWTRSIVKWTSFQGPIHVTKYEDWRAKLDQELPRLLQFMDISVSRRQLLCAVRNSEGLFHRKAGGSSLEFDKASRDILNAKIQFIFRKTKIKF